jgi:hypothetical protein
LNHDHRNQLLRLVFVFNLHLFRVTLIGSVSAQKLFGAKN